MLNELSGTQFLLGKEGMQYLCQAEVAIFGIGGVGSFTAEALVHSGVGSSTLFNGNRICPTDINRQIIAIRKTVDEERAEVMSKRALDINPKAQVKFHEVFYGAENADQPDLDECDYLVDTIDTISFKLVLIGCAKTANVPTISCVGAENKLDPIRFKIAGIYRAPVCPLARVMHNGPRKRGINSLKVAYSKESPLISIDDDTNNCGYHCICPPDTGRKCTIRRQVPGNTSFVPPVAGLILTREVIKDLTSAE